MFKVIESYEQALPLSEAGLLWYRRADGSSYAERDWLPDAPGWWCEPGWRRDQKEWDRLVRLTYEHAVLLED